MSAQKQIFIASSQEARKRFVEPLVKLLRTDLVPVPWWEAFSLGEYTFEDLARHARTVDGAIIVAASDDQVSSRDQLDKRPRDNVIFEFGIFAGRLGLKRAIILAEPGVQLPSDLKGVTILRLSEKIEETANEIKRHFSEEFRRDRAIRERPLRVVCHPKIASFQVDLKTIPKQWLMRKMYLGTDGARAWLETMNDPQYEDPGERLNFLASVLKLLEASDSTFRTYVSLGPGDAHIDRGVALSILEGEPSAQCIPVDLSDGLLWKAIETLSESIRVPIGLLADFEDHFEFISDQVQAYGKGPYLYGLFGGTFGSMDGPEFVFVQNLANAMGPKDEFVFDVTVVKEGKGYLDSTKWGDGTKHFFAHGASRYSKLAKEEIFEKFDELVTVRGATSDEPIAGTQRMTLYLQRTPFAIARRYVLEGLTKYFEDVGFVVRTKLLQIDGPYNIGIISLKRKQPKDDNPSTPDPTSPSEVVDPR